MSSRESDSTLEDLKLFLAYMQGIEPHQVEVRGLVPEGTPFGDDPRGYAELLREAMERAWTEHGNRPLPPGYEGP